MCPGCNREHSIPVIKGNETANAWGWNGDVERPTIRPSIFVNKDRWNPEIPACHSYVTEGKIGFLSDSSHHLAGVTVELPNLKESK